MGLIRKKQLSLCDRVVCSNLVNVAGSAYNTDGSDTEDIVPRSGFVWAELYLKPEPNCKHRNPALVGSGYVVLYATLTGPTLDRPYEDTSGSPASVRVVGAF